MKAIDSISSRCAIIILCLTIFLVAQISYAENVQYPIKVEIIDKDEATYDTPENAYAAMISSLLKRDLEWYYDTFTKKSAAQNKRQFQEANIDPAMKFNTVKGLRDIFIIEKMEYKTGVLLVVKAHYQNGAVTQGPSTFAKDGDKWKHTDEFFSDEDLWDYTDYIKPEEIISATIKIFPNRWNLNWYNWIKEHIEESRWIQYLAKRICILCLIGNLKDDKGNPHSVKEIVPETLLLNYLLHPQPWRFMGKEEIAIVLGSKKDRHLRRMKGFKEWHHTSRCLDGFVGPVMLVRFNKFKAMETLPEMIPGKEYEVTVSGELKDGKHFKGTAKITITGWRRKHGGRRGDADGLNSEKDIHNWWNNHNDVEGSWENMKKQEE